MLIMATVVLIASGLALLFSSSAGWVGPNTITYRRTINWFPTDTDRSATFRRRPRRRADRAS
jgi:hypothetical protein